MIVFIDLSKTSSSGSVSVVANRIVRMARNSSACPPYTEVTLDTGSIVETSLMPEQIKKQIKDAYAEDAKQRSDAMRLYKEV